MLPCSLAFTPRILKIPCVGHQKSSDQEEVLRLVENGERVGVIINQEAILAQDFEIKPKLMPAFFIFCTAFQEAPDRMDIHRRPRWLVERTFVGTTSAEVARKGWRHESSRLSIVFNDTFSNF